MHILHVETGRHLYGGALQVLYLMEGLKTHGCRNTLVCMADSAIAQRATTCAVVCEIPMAGELDPIFIFRLARILRAQEPDIVHIHSRKGADFWGVLAAWIAKTKVVLTRRVDNPEPSWLARAKYGFCDQIITISNGIRQVLLAEGIPDRKIVCVPSALDSDRYDRPCDREWFFREFGLRADTKTIGVIAQFIPRKGHRYLIEAAPRILARHPNTQFLFLGQGLLRAEMKQLCREHKVDDKVLFLGFRTDVERILPCLNLVVHPAIMEGLGVSLMQASAAGVPVVASRVGGIPEVVRNGVNGILVPPGDVQGIASAVIRLLGDPAKRPTMGQAGRQLVRTEFSIEKMTAGNLRVYHGVLASE